MLRVRPDFFRRREAIRKPIRTFSPFESLAYVDLLGFAMPADLADTAGYGYVNLYDVVTDRSFYPGPTAAHQTLKVRS